MSAAVWSDPSISDPCLLLTMLAMADFADDDGRCWPAVDTLARKLRVNSRTVQRRIRTLKEAGKITILTRCGRCNTNRYVITPSKENPEKVTPEAEKVTPMSPFSLEKVTSGALNGDTGGLNGDTAMSPDPSIDPSVQPSGTTKGAPPESDDGQFNLKADTFEVDPLAVPQDLCTPEVLDAWDDWLEHRKEIKKPVTRVAAKLQFRELRAWGALRWINAIHFSIRNRYRGCFEERVNPRSNGSPPSPQWSAQNCQAPIKAKIIRYVNGVRTTTLE